MTESDAQAPFQAPTATQALPRDGEQCEECGAPLASDQRYCLECGRRRGGPRVDYRHYMGGAESQAAGPSAAEAAPSPAAPGEVPEKPQRDYAPLAAVGGIAVLGLMLLIGVLIGKGNDNGGTAAAPPVIKLPTAAASSEEGGGKSSKNTAGEEGLGLGGSGKKAKGGGGKGGGGTGNAVKASKGDLEELSGETGESYEKQSENLPNEIATPGAPPPIDKSKPPGGGEGGAEVIK